MNKITYLSPAKILLPEDSERVKKFLTYTDKSVSYMIYKLKQKYKKDPYNVWIQKKIEALQQQKNKTLLFYDLEENPYTYSGFAQDLAKTFGWEIEPYQYQLHIPHYLPYINKPPEMRLYQMEAFNALVQNRHSAIELPTGSGKSRIILELLKQFPVKTLIITPYTNITNQLADMIKYYFGSQYLGIYGGSKKQYNKLFIVANGQSITRIKKNTPEWNELSKVQMFISDESQFISVDTFESVAMGVAEFAPLRYFISATQTRNDGSEIKLYGLINKIVYKKDYVSLAEEGFLKKMRIFTCNISIYNDIKSDPKEEIRNNLYYNPKVHECIAKLVDTFINKHKRQVLIMIEEYDQFLMLKNYLTCNYEFLHGKVSSQNIKNKLPDQYLNNNTKQIIEDFNNGKIKCLIGTSAVGVGVDFKPVGVLIYFQGGKSEIKLKQSLGRGSRPVGFKDLWVVDFNIYNSPKLLKHFLFRKSIYQEICNNFVEFNYQ